MYALRCTTRVATASNTHGKGLVDFGRMPSTLVPYLADLPAETVSLVLEYVNFNGDLPAVRGVNRRLYAMITRSSRALSKDTCRQYGIPLTGLEHYSALRDDLKTRGAEEGMLLLLALRSELHAFQRLTIDAGRRNIGEADSMLHGLLLFSIFAKTLHDQGRRQDSTTTIMVSDKNLNKARCIALNQRSMHLLETGFTLIELESMVTAINMCASKLWSNVSGFRLADAQTQSFANLGGYTFSIEQAILTEAVIWKGPTWVARMPRTSYLASGHPIEDMDTRGRFEVLLNGNDLWRGSREEGARLAATGVARLLWRVRSKRVEDEQMQKKREEQAQPVAITDLKLNAAVWRGSAGDM